MQTPAVVPWQSCADSEQMSRDVKSCRKPFPNSLCCDKVFFLDFFPNSILVKCNDSKAFDPSSGSVGAIITLWSGLRFFCCCYI